MIDSLELHSCEAQSNPRLNGGARNKPLGVAWSWMKTNLGEAIQLEGVWGAVRVRTPSLIATSFRRRAVLRTCRVSQARVQKFNACSSPTPSPSVGDVATFKLCLQLNVLVIARKHSLARVKTHLVVPVGGRRPQLNRPRSPLDSSTSGGCSFLLLPGSLYLAQPRPIRARTTTLPGRCALVLRRLNAAALSLETSKRIPVTRIYTSAQQTNFGRGKWWNTVLSNQNVVIGILWTLDALVDVCGPTMCAARCLTPGCRLNTRP